MAGGIEVVAVFWREWGIQALVLLSFALQVILLITASIRHRKDSGVLRAIVWSAYVLADTTAIYALGHMSVSSSKWLPEQQLMAFWAPFLLLHLGGQDNITSYSIEDNRLWLRHLQTFAVQVLAAGYILYQSSIVARRTLLRPAAILMFVIGVIKYGERVWALNCASSSNLSGKNYQSFGRVELRLMDWWTCRRAEFLSAHDDERLMLLAHKLLHTPLHLLKGPLPLLVYGKDYSNFGVMYRVAEMQLSLMYDVFYSKTPVIHTWYGYCIRVISPMAIVVVAWLVFCQLSERDGDHYNRLDVTATYVLLAGAIVLEITSLLRAMFSSWARAKFTPTFHVQGPCCLFACVFRRLLFLVITFARCLVKCAMRKAGMPVSRYWSGSMGQYNFLHMCTKSRSSRRSKVARWLGREDWWNTLVYTYSTPVPENFSQLLQTKLEESMKVGNKSPDHIRNSRGRAVLTRMGWHEELSWSVDIQLEESILVWHVATHVYLCWYDEKHSTRPNLAKVIQVLSNYMIFLLAERPYMLPDNASRQRYVELCNKVINHLQYSSMEHLVRIIRGNGEIRLNASAPRPRASETTSQADLTYDRASHLAAKLIITDSADMLDIISQVWIEMLCYVSYRCRAESHARQLSDGGEIMTIVAIMMEYMRTDFLDIIDRHEFWYT